jgi:hypothetical protein
MTEHRPGLRLEISRTAAPDGSIRVLIQTDDWHLLLPPYDAIDIADTMREIARAIIAERN